MLLIVIGLFGLWIGTKWIINGAVGIAERFNLSHSFVGIAILAVGTDLPEVFVSTKAALLHLQGIESSGIIIGNALGSSISQITFILGIAGLLMNFKIAGKDLLRDAIALLLSIVLLFVFGMDGVINRTEGGIMLLVYALYYFVLIKNKTNHDTPKPSDQIQSKNKLWLMLIAGFVVLVFSSHLVVENAVELSVKWGVQQSFIGIAIVGLGTSLPELAVTIGAARRNSAGMTAGNIIGSNIFDGFIPIGLGGAISTANMEKKLLYFDLPFLLGMTLLALLFLQSKRGISKPEGVTLAGIYLVYIVIKMVLI